MEIGEALIVMQRARRIFPAVFALRITTHYNWMNHRFTSFIASAIELERAHEIGSTPGDSSPPRHHVRLGIKCEVSRIQVTCMRQAHKLSLSRDLNQAGKVGDSQATGLLLIERRNYSSSIEETVKLGFLAQEIVTWTLSPKLI
jgi:hypothetical protein